MEALRSDSLEAQKENVDAVFVGGGKSTLGTKGAKRSYADAFTAGGARKGLLTPSAKRSALSVHSDGKPARKGLKDSAKKTRRVLGDISNRHVNRREGSDPGEGVTAKKKSTAVIKTPMGKSKTPRDTPKTREATPLKATPIAKTLEAVKPTSKDHVEEVELPYGGLPSPTSDDKSLREEMLREIQDDKTPMFFDNFDVTDPLDEWDCKKEREMLETGAVPSEWWAPPPREIEIPVMDNLEDIPPPVEFADDELDPVDGLDSLDEALNVDLDAAASD